MTAQRVVKKLSNQQVIRGPLDKLAKTKKGGLLFYRETNLNPGHYTIAAVVYDNITRQSSTNTGTVIVPPADQTALRLSSIVVIKKAERPTAGNRICGLFSSAICCSIRILVSPSAKRTETS